MDRDFAKDVNDGLNKIMEICQWLKDSFHIEVGRNLKSWQNEKENVIDIEAVDSSLNKKEVESSVAKIKNIYHRKDGRWEYIKKQNGNKIYLIASTKEQLLEKVREEKEQNKKQTKKEAMTFVQWCLRWLDIYKQDLRTSSQKRYKQIIEKYIQPFFKETPLKKVNQEQVQRFVNSMTGERNKEYSFLTVRQALKQAFINKKINEDISVMLVKPKRHRKIRRTALSLIEQQELMRVLQEYEPNVKMFILFSIILGTRRSETMRFKLEDINHLTKRIHIKGTKTYGADRNIKITDDMINLLEQNAERKSKEFYFYYNPDYYTKIIQEIYEKAKIRDKTLHDLRHTCATNLLYLGMPDKFRQQYLGHANIVMTNDVYTNLQDDLNKDDLLKLYNNLYPKI